MGKPSKTIFVNYRRGDERAFAARIRDRLAQSFGDAGVFMDIDNLRAGQRFDRELAAALDKTDIFLAVIGPSWMDLYEHRRASAERDYVHEEIAAALSRGLTVIPVLIEGARLPNAESLPKDISELVLHQKHDITHEYFGQNVKALIDAIRLERKSRNTSDSNFVSGWLGVAISIAILAGLDFAGPGFLSRVPWPSAEPRDVTGGGSDRPVISSAPNAPAQDAVQPVGAGAGPDQREKMDTGDAKEALARKRIFTGIVADDNSLEPADIAAALGRGEWVKYCLAISKKKKAACFASFEKMSCPKDSNEAKDIPGCDPAISYKTYQWLAGR